MKSKKTVLFVHHSSAMGGAPRSLAMLINQLARERWRPVTLTPSEGPVAQLFRDAGSEVIIDSRIRRFPGSTSPVNSPLRLAREWLLGKHTASAVSEHVRSLAPAIVHINSTSLFMAARGARQEAPSVRIVCHARETLVGGLGTYIIRRMNHRYCDAFIALDIDGLGRLHVDGKDARVIHNFVEISKFAAYDRQPYLQREYRLCNRDVTVLFLARFSSLNGVLEAIRMIRRLPAEFSCVHFFFVGYIEEDVLPETVCSIWKAGLGGVKRLVRNAVPGYLARVQTAAYSAQNIHLIPFQNDILPFLGSADILFCPFTKPHFARSIIEAGAMGIPSLTADIPSLRTLVNDGHTGLLYQVDSQTSFESALRRLAFDPQVRTAMGEAAHKLATQLFDAHKNALATFTLYDLT